MTKKKLPLAFQKCPGLLYFPLLACKDGISITLLLRVSMQGWNWCYAVSQNQNARIEWVLHF